MLSQIGFDSADHRGSVRIADLLEDEAHRISTLLAERAGKEIGTVFQLLRGLPNSLTCVFRDGARRASVVKHGGNRTRCQADVLRYRAQRDRAGRTLSGIIHLGHPWRLLQTGTGPAPLICRNRWQTPATLFSVLRQKCVCDIPYF